MRIYIVLFLISFNTIGAVAQNIVLVKYVEFLNNDFPFSMNEYLYINTEKNETTYLIDYVNQMSGELSEEMKQEIAKADVLAEPGRQDGPIYDYIVIDHNDKKQVIQYEDFYKRFFKIKDDSTDVQLELVPEQEHGDGLDAQTAVTLCGDSIGDAWYALATALESGLWKLHRVAGIVVEPNDPQKRFNSSMVSIDPN